LKLYPKFPNLVVSLSVLAIVSFVALDTVLQGVPDFAGWEDLSLKGALIAAVIVLWRALVKKDDQLMVSTKTTTEAMSANAATQVELRKIIEAQNALIESSISAKVHLTEAQSHLVEAIDMLRARLSEAPDCGNFVARK
jgi:hypothetical protein